MSGFGKDKIEFDLPIKRDEVGKLLRQYKKIKKYQKSNLYTIKELNGTEDIIAPLIDEAKDIGF